MYLTYFIETSQWICSETESHLKFTTMTLHQKINFPLKISSVIATFSEEILNGKLPFFVQEVTHVHTVVDMGCRQKQISRVTWTKSRPEKFGEIAILKIFEKLVV